MVATGQVSLSEHDASVKLPRGHGPVQQPNVDTSDGRASVPQRDRRAVLAIRRRSAPFARR
jgi:hypothetical protein